VSEEPLRSRFRLGRGVQSLLAVVAQAYQVLLKDWMDSIPDNEATGVAATGLKQAQQPLPHGTSRRVPATAKVPSELSLQPVERAAPLLLRQLMKMARSPLR
jgi:hypothetical protein